MSEWRPRIEHAQIFAPNDLKRIGELGGRYLLYLAILQVPEKFCFFFSDCERSANSCVRYFDVIPLSNGLIETQNI